MENKRAPIFALWVSGIIIGVALFKQIDFSNLTIESPALSIVYFLTLAFIVFVLIKNAKKK